MRPQLSLSRPTMTILALAWAVTLAVAQPEPPDGAASGPRRITISLANTPIAQAVRMLARMSDLKVVLGTGAGERTVTVSLQDVDAESALQAICEAAGLQWSERDGVFVLETKPGDVQVTVAPVRRIPAASWRPWDGRLPDELAALEFVPLRTKTVQGESKLTGTLSAIVDDLKSAGVDIGIDPSATVGLAETALELGWHGERNTVEHVLLRLAVAARTAAAGPRPGRFTVVRYVDPDLNTTDRLRVVPGDRLFDTFGVYEPFSRYLGAAAAPAMPGLADIPAPPDPAALGDLLREQHALIEAAPAPLQTKIDLDLTDVHLSEALEALEAKLGMPITLAEGVTADPTVSVHVQGAAILRVLCDILRPLGLTITYARGDDFHGVTVIPMLTTGPSVFEYAPAH